MRSTPAPGSADLPAGSTEPPGVAAASTARSDRTARARIRDAAITRFAADGVAATSIRAIAAEADVSPGLVIHHFGSKDGLRAACDAHVAARIRQAKQQAVAAGAALDPIGALRAASQGPPVLRYLARTLAEASPQVAALVDELVDDAVAYQADGVRTGMLTESDDPRGRAVVLTMWSLGALVLHEHVARLTGVDLTEDPATSGAWVVPATEALARGVLAEEIYDRVRDGFAAEEDGHDGR